MPDLIPDGTPPRLNLESDTEATRRALYDVIVRIQFSAVAGASPDDYPGPSYTPDAAGLKVFRVFGRWFAAWTNMEEPGLPEDQQQELVRITADSDAPYGVMMREV